MALHKSSFVRWAALAVAAVAGYLIVSTLISDLAAANHIAGATYTGTHSGGGSVEFDITGDGSGISRFRVTNVPGDTCTFSEIEVNYATPVPIDNHTFNRQVASGLSFEGSFLTPGTASGTLKVHQNAIPFVQPACDSGTLNWSASTNATASPSPTTPISTPVPTPTPSPTTPISTPTPTSTGEGQQVAWGDNNCSGAADPVDALLTLRNDAGLSTNTGSCPAFGTPIALIASAQMTWGDIDCSGAADPVDALKILRFDAGLSAATGSCPALGTQVTIAVE
ncbi:MAG TPA: hypothetical protein VMR52_01570 [Dehalococcoidia bacterium]|nr:hypothetical protein [Dehalococcoidia bacterium]